MKAKIILSAAILSLAAAGAAQAASNIEPNDVPFQGVYGQSDGNSLSRAQVEQQLQQAQAAGQTGNGDEDNTPFTAQNDSGVTGAQINADANHHAPGDVSFGDIDNQPFQPA
jgi:opacity protein-like surface antigen